MNRKEHSSLSEELQHLRDSLLRDTNRGMDQQRVIEKMKAERRETICVQAHQRQQLERDLCEAEKKVKHIGYPVWFVAASRGPTFHLQWGVHFVSETHNAGAKLQDKAVSNSLLRLRVVPHFSSGIVERAKRESA